MHHPFLTTVLRGQTGVSVKRNETDLPSEYAQGADLTSNNNAH